MDNDPTEKFISNSPIKYIQYNERATFSLNIIARIVAKRYYVNKILHKKHHEMNYELI